MHGTLCARDVGVGLRCPSRVRSGAVAARRVVLVLVSVGAVIAVLLSVAAGALEAVSSVGLFASLRSAMMKTQVRMGPFGTANQGSQRTQNPRNSCSHSRSFLSGFWAAEANRSTLHKPLLRRVPSSGYTKPRSRARCDFVVRKACHLDLTVCNSEVPTMHRVVGPALSIMTAWVP